MRTLTAPARPTHGRGPKRGPVKPLLAPEPGRLPTAQERAGDEPPFPGMRRCDNPTCSMPWVPSYYFLEAEGLCLDCGYATGAVRHRPEPNAMRESQA